MIMTREEEIVAKSKEYLPDIFDDEYPYKAEFVFGFQEGAKWADEHQDLNGKELLYVAQKTAERTKKEIIRKACEWLKLNTNWDDEWDEMGRNMDYGMIEEFRKAMEE